MIGRQCSYVSSWLVLVKIPLKCRRKSNVDENRPNSSSKRANSDCYIDFTHSNVCCVDKIRRIFHQNIASNTQIQFSNHISVKWVHKGWRNLKSLPHIIKLFVRVFRLFVIHYGTLCVSTEPLNKTFILFLLFRRVVQILSAHSQYSSFSTFHLNSHTYVNSICLPS